MRRNKSVSCYKGLDNQQMIDIDCTFPWFACPCLTNISNNKTIQWHLNANEYPRILNGIASEWLKKFHWKQSKKISNDQELIQSDPISCPQNQKGNN